jgi:hypothetical protein
MAFKTELTGTTTADGTEQTLVTVTLKGRVSGYLSLENMQAGDTLVLSQYILIDGSYELYASETYTDAQAEDVIYITDKEVGPATRITIRQTAGTNRDYPFVIIRETAGASEFEI